MRFISSAAAVIAALLLGACTAPDAHPPGTDFTRDFPPISAAEAGWSAPDLAAAQDWSQQINSTAVLVIQHDRLVAAWGDTVKRTELASVRKSFLSALIGIAVAERKLRLDSSLAELGIDDNPPALTDAEQQATVRMLLEARSGVYHAALYETPGMAARRPPRGSHPPGSFWYYNNWDFNALGTIYEQAAGTGIYDALDRLIAQPIGMQDYRPEDGQYFYGAASIHRAYPIRMSARDLARFALLYLHHGVWHGRQVVPADWIETSTRTYSTTEPSEPGYGMLWWTAGARSVLPPGSYFAWGAGGQFAFVIPAYDMVVVSRVDRDQHFPDPPLRDLTKLLRLIFKAGGLGAA